MPVTASLLTAEKLGYNKIKVLKYANSGDTFGDKGKVVGYLSAAIYRNDSPQSTVHSQRAADTRPETADQRLKTKECEAKRSLPEGDEGVRSEASPKGRAKWNEASPKETNECEAERSLSEGEREAKRSLPEGESEVERSLSEGDEKTGELPMLNGAERKRLLQIARESIVSHIRGGKRQSFTEADPVLNKPMGAFVTLRQNGELRGCIGNLTGHGPLYQTIADMAVESATGDPRFPPLASSEIGNVDIEISVLSEMKRVKSADEVKIPGHGVLIRKGYSSGVFLPQVADETGWSKEEFLSNLCSHKAGLPPGAWKDPATEIYIFTAEVFGEKE